MWKPILTGRLRAAAWSAIEDIATSLAGLREPAPELALFWTYLDAATGAKGPQKAAALRGFARSIELGIAGAQLFGGLAGTGWIAGHIASDVEPFLEQLDEALLETLSVQRWPHPYDLISGLVGISIYYLQRSSMSSTRGLTLIVRHLEQLSACTGDGVTWHTSPAHLPDHQRVRFPSGYYNCGVAHGVPGVIAALGKVAARADAPSSASRLREEATRWLLSQRDDLGFPAFVHGPKRAQARTAWCYGDAGVHAALLSGAALRQRGNDEVLGLGNWTTRSSEAAGVVDTGLCHGASGLAHIANRLYQHTGEPLYKEAATRWYGQVLSMQQPEKRFGGFPQFSPAFAPETPWQENASLLDGAIGVALALLAAVVPNEPEWDRLLLCDLPPIAMGRTSTHRQTTQGRGRP